VNGQHRVVIIGGGFGGLTLAKALAKAPVQVTLVDRRNFHLFQPLLYQVATGALSPANIAAPLRAVLKKQKNALVLLGEVNDFDPAQRRVLLHDGTYLDYDSLIVATGARHHYFGHPEWEALAPGLKTVEDATAMRRRILTAFEMAERETDPERLRAWLTFVIVGGGPTGVELAGAVAEVARHTLRGNFRNIDPRMSRIYLLEAGERILPSFPPKLSRRAFRDLGDLGVTVLCGTAVTAIQEGLVTMRSGEHVETIPTHTVLWGAGVQGSPLGQKLAAATGATLDRAGRVVVGFDLTVPNYPDIFVIGDLANVSHQTGQPLPGVAPVAMQEGAYVARLIQRRLQGLTLPPFVYKDPGSMATIGPSRAVALLGPFKFTGFFAWLIWLFVHLLYIVEFQNRLLILTQWAWNYVTRNRSARLITGDGTPAHDGAGPR
jgi:NADH dehydrogenase